MNQNNVNKQQNEPFGIDMLNAQRHYYLLAKRMVLVSLFFCVILVAVLSVTNRLIQSDFLAKAVLIYSLIALVLNWLFANKRNQLQNLAARIQHLFDIRLFGLTWDKALCGVEPRLEDIERGKQNDPKKLNDWYLGVPDDLPVEVVALVCMRMNVAYDQSMKRRLTTLIYLSFFVILLIIIMANLQRSIFDFLICFVAPMIPVFKFFYDAKQRVDKDKDRLIRLDTLIDAAIKKALKGEVIEQSELQKINNLIFEHRNTSPLMPEWFYNILRKKEEETSAYSANYYYNEFRKAYASK